MCCGFCWCGGSQWLNGFNSLLGLDCWWVELCLIMDCVGGLGGCGVGYGRFLLGVWLTVGWGGL